MQTIIRTHTATGTPIKVIIDCNNRHIFKAYFNNVVYTIRDFNQSRLTHLIECQSSHKQVENLLNAMTLS